MRRGARHDSNPRRSSTDSAAGDAISTQVEASRISETSLRDLRRTKWRLIRYSNAFDFVPGLARPLQNYRHSRVGENPEGQASVSKAERVV